MGKGDIRTRRGKVWRGTYGVTRPRRYKTVVRPHATTRKAKSLKDLPKAAAEAVKKPVIEEVQPVIPGVTAEVPQIVSETVTETSGEAGTKAKKPAAKKAPRAKKSPAKKKE